MKCNQKGCDEIASYKFTWPGNDDDVICENHVGQLIAIASAMGMHLQVTPIPEHEKQISDAVVYGQGVLVDGKHVPATEVMKDSEGDES